MLVTVLIALAALVALGVVLAGGLTLAVRRPALLARLMRVGLFRRFMAWLTRAGIRRARKRSAGSGVPATDLEIVLADQTGPEAERAKAMLRRMNPRQRAEFSRQTMGSDGLAGLMRAAGDTADALGRSERRRSAGVATTGAAGRTARQRKVVAKRRKARKAARTR